MQHSDTHIIPLIIKDINHSISPQEKKILLERMEKDPDVRKLHEEFAVVLGTSESREIMNNLHVRLPKSGMLAYARKQKRITAIRRGALSAVAVCVVALVAVVSFRHQQSPAPSVNQQVSLKIGGERIDLTAGLHRSVAGAKLSTSGDQLQVDQSSSTQLAELDVPAGKTYQLSLSDGTQLMLNSMSSVKFPTRFAPSDRQISVSGEVYIQVAKDASRPFRIHVPRGTIQVLGTSLNINTYDSSRVQVALIDGRVQVASSAGQPVMLSPGQAVTIAGDSREMVLSTFDSRRLLSWRSGLFYYHDYTVADLSLAISRMYGVRVFIDDAVTGQHRVSGVLDRNEPIDSLMNTLVITSGIHFQQREDGIHMNMN